MYVANYEIWEEDCKKEYYSDRALQVQTVKNGIVLPAILNVYNPWSYSGGVCDENFNFVSGLLRGDYSYIHGDILTSYKCDENSVIYSSEDVIYGGVLIGYFWHM